MVSISDKEFQRLLDKDVAKIVRQRLEELLVKSRRARDKNPIWKAVKSILEGAGYWKRLARGKRIDKVRASYQSRY